MFRKHGTMCEAPGCTPPAPAFAPYQSEWSFAFLCETHYGHAKGQIGTGRLAWDKKLAEHLLSLFHRQSYIKTNVASSFALEASISARLEVQKELDRLEASKTSRERSELRKQIRESNTKIGTADDSILTARQRQDERVAQGSKPLGPKPVDRTALLIPRLVVASTTTKEDDA